MSGGDSMAALLTSTTTSGGPFGGGEVLRAEVTHQLGSDTTAVVGVSRPQQGAGIGGYFKGGAYGAYGTSDIVGYGIASGILGDNAGGALIGVHGSCYLACSRAVLATGDLEYTGSLIKPSDLRFKESLAPLDRAVSKLLDLQVVSYEHVRSEELAPMNLPEGPQVGFIAQQVAEVLPELVVESVHPGRREPVAEGPDAEPIRYLALKQLQLIPYLVKAIQEQQAQIEALEAELQPRRTALSSTTR